MEMENVNIQDLDIEIGTKEQIKLTPKRVKIIEPQIIEVKSKEGKYIGKKLVCLSKHPDKSEAVAISSIQFLKDKKVITAGIWLTKDSCGLIQKGSGLATLLERTNSKTIKDLVGKEIETDLEDSGYLCFRLF